MTIRFVKPSDKISVSIKNVTVEDWNLLTGIADKFGLTMADMIHNYAEKFRFKTDTKAISMLELLKEKEEREQKNLQQYVASGDAVAVTKWITDPSQTKLCPICGSNLTKGGVCPSCGLIPPDW